MADGARGRREAIRQLAEVRRRLAAAEDVLATAQAQTKRAEEEFDAASDRFAAAESALDAAREQRATARRERYAARQAHEQAATMVARLQRRAGELAERLDRMEQLTGTPLPCTGQVFGSCGECAAAGLVELPGAMRFPTESQWNPTGVSTVAALSCCTSPWPSADFAAAALHLRHLKSASECDSYDLGSTTLVTTQRCLPILRSRMNPSFS